MPQLRSPIKGFLMKTFDLEPLEKKCDERSGPSRHSSRKTHTGSSKERPISGRNMHHEHSAYQKPMSPRTDYEEERADIEEAIVRQDRAIVDQERSRLNQERLIADQKEARARRMVWEDEVHRLAVARAKRIEDEEEE